MNRHQDFGSAFEQGGKGWSATLISGFSSNRRKEILLMLLNAISRTDVTSKASTNRTAIAEFCRIQHWNFLLSRRSMARISPLSVS